MKFLNVKDLQNIFDCSQATASRKYQYCRDTLNVYNRQISIDEFCKLFDMNKTDVLSKIKQ